MEFPFILALIVAGVASVTDIYNNHIYDYLTYPAIAMGIILNMYLASSLSLPIAGKILLMPTIAFAFGLLLYKLAWWGGGDVKLVTALTAFMPAYAFQFMFFPILLLFPVGVVQALKKRSTNALGQKEAVADVEVELPSAPFFLGAVVVSLFTTVLVI